ncbi:hypothetical protein BAUCODRAFT_36496 [Baudoinia panamericana UAMH 10762]|uniref:Uncharacterized protein n=1 Tax=Baudoinia panamericana (strain UAMH 10762) TaxID=717646 RepID=M2MC18_BAUPA|nr:uncharacterized protein BAUCODRAFT_36496 [Baudoinia panamericana UAMH 10762]EMC94026.1 hypothetical protein BAUCODRAFT_36496 [Baudoinia panamericana UAMH 10762]
MSTHPASGPWSTISYINDFHAKCYFRRIDFTKRYADRRANNMTGIHTDAIPRSLLDDRELLCCRSSLFKAKQEMGSGYE